jgi:hypothetical protein
VRLQERVVLEPQRNGHLSLPEGLDNNFSVARVPKPVKKVTVVRCFGSICGTLDEFQVHQKPPTSQPAYPHSQPAST